MSVSNGLKDDLASAKSTPSFSYIVPGRCDDGDPTPCTPGAPAGMEAADGWLAKVVPEILGSKAYKESGLLVITIDEAPSSGEYADSSSCCGQPTYPNLPAPSGALGKPGGGQVGALLLSPFVKGGNLAPGPVQPLLAAAHGRGHLRALPPRLCGRGRGQLVQPVVVLGVEEHSLIPLTQPRECPLPGALAHRHERRPREALAQQRRGGELEHRVGERRRGGLAQQSRDAVSISDSGPPSATATTGRPEACASRIT